jgi:hypothetical protein
MADIYTDLQSVAAGVLGEFKQGTVDYVEMTPGAGPSDNPGEPTPTYHPINAVARGVSFKYVNNSDIVSSDLQLTMPGNGVIPTMKGFIRVDGTQYKIVSVKPIPAAGTPVTYVVIFRK